MRIFDILSIKKIIKLDIFILIGLFLVISLRIQYLDNRIYFYFTFSLFSIIFSILCLIISNLILFLKVFYDIKRKKWI